MNAPRHDPDELKAALDTFLEAEQQEAALKAQREDLSRRIGQQAAIFSAARDRASKLLLREGGAVTYGERFWKAEESGRVTHEPVRVNLDAIDEVKRHKATNLVLTPNEEKAA